MRAKLEPYDKQPLPNYDVVPLRRNEIRVAAAQMTTKLVDPKNPKKGIKENVEHMLFLVDAVQSWPIGRKDLVCFPEFSLQGYDLSWTREDWLRVAIDLPGEETELIGKKAKELNCYIEFGCHTKDKDWPGHYFNTSVIIGPSGSVIHKHWKAYCDPGAFEYATTVHDVLDEFVERYGWDMVWPVARTDIGNIATFVCSEGFQPETARAFAFKGGEILVRSINGGAYLYSEMGARLDPGGDPRITMQAYCMENNVYGVFVNNATCPSYRFYPGAGFSTIFDNKGRVLKVASTTDEAMIAEQIPIGSFRKGHSIPILRKELYERAYAEYVGKYPPNMYLEYLPKDTIDGINYARRKARW